MEQWEKFRTLKERGEWVELQFMAAAALHGYHVLKPWGDSLMYDVAIEDRGRLMRVQVKSSSARNGTGYLCQFRRNYLVKEPYTTDDVDLFATYVIPAATWYLIPAIVILKPTVKVALTLCPVTALKKSRKDGTAAGCPISRALFAREVGVFPPTVQTSQLRNRNSR